MKLLRVALLAAALLAGFAAPASADELSLEVQDVDTSAYPSVSVSVTPPGAAEAPGA